VCKDWRCVDGVVGGRNPQQSRTTAQKGPLEGEFVNSEDIVVAFSVATLDGGATQAVYTGPAYGDGCELVVTLTDGDHATMTWNGVELTGQGALSAAQQAALTSLDQSPLVSALVKVPLELGCQPDLAEAPVAALLFPFQVLLKYTAGPASRDAALEALGTSSLCRYFGGRTDLDTGSVIDGQTRLGPLQFGPSMRIPSVFNYFPLDATGASESTSQPLEGDLTGPCNARCRGACGPDCPDTCLKTSLTLCSNDGGVDVDTVTYVCGVADGCVEHDNCYDVCHTTYACESWGAAFCRKGCDYLAAAKWGTATGLMWARGYGPMQRTDTFVYVTPDPGACACVAPGTQVALADGGSRPIEVMSPGDGILAFDVDAGVLVKARVEKVLVHQDTTYALDRLRASGGETLDLTGNHPVFTARGFVATSNLVVGDTVYVVDEAALQTRQEKLVAITRRASTTQVTYNLKTTAGNYFAADLLIHNKCLAGDAPVQTARGVVPVAEVRPGDQVRGVRDGAPTWTPVLAVFEKRTALPSLPGRRVTPSLAVTDNHVLSAQGRPAGALGLPPVELSGPVFDLETGTGNFEAGGVLLEAANAPVR
jgi:Hint module